MPGSSVDMPQRIAGVAEPRTERAARCRTRINDPTISGCVPDYRIQQMTLVAPRLLVAALVIDLSSYSSSVLACCRKRR